MRCEQAMELLSAKLDGELDRQTDEALSRHLETCEACRALWAAYCEIDQGVAALEVDPPAELYDGVMAKITTLPEIKPVKKRRTMWGAGSLVAAAAAFALLLGTGTLQLPDWNQAGRFALTMTEEVAAEAELPEAASGVMETEQAAAEPETAQAVPETAQVMPAEEAYDGAAAASAEPFVLEPWLEGQTMPVMVMEMTYDNASAMLQEWETLDWLEVPGDLALWQPVADNVWSCEIDTALAEEILLHWDADMYHSQADAAQTVLLLMCSAE